MTRSLLRTVAPLGIAVALVAAAATAAAADKSPLATWMTANMGNAILGPDFPALKTNFDLLASKQPAGYSDWAKFAKAGAAAAVKQDQAAAHSACDSCHHEYKAKYRKDFPKTPFP